jgi:hypothetical protein
MRTGWSPEGLRAVPLAVWLALAYGVMCGAACVMGLVTGEAVIPLLSKGRGSSLHAAAADGLLWYSLYLAIDFLLCALILVVFLRCLLPRRRL